MESGDREIRGLQSEWSMKGEQRKWKKVIKVEGRKNYRKQRNFWQGTQSRPRRNTL